MDKISTFGCKVCWYVLTEKWQFREIGTSMIKRLFAGRLGLLHVRYLKEAAFGENYGLELCG